MSADDFLRQRAELRQRLQGELVGLGAAAEAGNMPTEELRRRVVEIYERYVGSDVDQLQPELDEMLAAYESLHDAASRRDLLERWFGR